MTTSTTASRAFIRSAMIIAKTNMSGARIMRRRLMMPAF